MPKHGFKWRAERLRSLDPREVEAFLSHENPEIVSAKLARWIYRNLAANDSIRLYALERVATDEAAPWARTFLLRELETHKSSAFGDWVVIALTRHGVNDARNLGPFIDVYEDETAHPKTRGSAVYGMHSAAGMASCWPEKAKGVYPLSPPEWERVRAVCARALRDPIPYARAGACGLAQSLGGFEDELDRLSQDRSLVHPEEGSSITVAGEARL